jgi:hypothetical protein
VIKKNVQFAYEYYKNTVLIIWKILWQNNPILSVLNNIVVIDF